jgi:hypothetical protein
MEPKSAVPTANEKSKLSININIPKSWAEGEELAFPIKTGLKRRTFVFVTVQPPTDSLEDFISVDVTHFGEGISTATKPCLLFRCL